jgi:hypothetical protein
MPTPTNPLTTVGLMLTLASLLGSFFYIQLSQWLRDLVALRAKTELNEPAGTEAAQRAIVECKIEYAKLTSSTAYTVNRVVIGFVLFVLANGLLMVLQATSDPLFGFVLVPMLVFAGVFIYLSRMLLREGRTNADAIKTILDKFA